MMPKISPEAAQVYKDIASVAKALCREPPYDDHEKILKALRGAIAIAEKKHGLIPEAGFTWRIP